MDERIDRSRHRLWYAAGVVVLLFLIVFPFFRTRERAFISTLARQVQQGEGTIVHFSDLARFQWDRVCVFAPYTSASQIEQTLGFTWPGAKESGIEMTETFHLIVFLSGRQVALSARLPRSTVDFVPSDCGRLLTQDLSDFVVARDVGGDRLLLRQVSPKTVSANPTLQPTATSLGLRHQVTMNSITPSLWLLSHPSCRRSTSKLADVFSQVAVAELFR